MTTSSLRRWSCAVAAGVVGGVAAPLLVAAPALAIPDGSEPGSGLSILQTLLVFLGGPLLLFALLAVAVALPAMRKQPRYQPGRPWQHDPVWFAGPDDPQAALTAHRPGKAQGGGASVEW